MRIVAARSFKALALLLAAGSLPAAAQQGSPAATPPGPPFTMMSSAFSDGGELPVKYSCDGKLTPVSPSLQWSNIPAGTASLALIFHDPDAVAANSVWDVTHWIMWNIPATLTQLPEGVAVSSQMPDGTIQGKNIAGANGYRGPCPPPGKQHHYTFELYALDIKLDSGPDTSRADVLKTMDGHILGKAVYVVYFHR